MILYLFVCQVVIYHLLFPVAFAQSDVCTCVPNGNVMTVKC